MKVALTYTIITTMMMELFPQCLVSLFTSSPELLNIGSKMLRVYIFGTYVLGINSTCQQTYNSMGEGKKSFFFAFYRKIILLIPLIFILPMFMHDQMMAVVLVEPISDLLTTCTNYVYFKKFVHYKLEIQNNL